MSFKSFLYREQQGFEDKMKNNPVIQRTHTKITQGFGLFFSPVRLCPVARGHEDCVSLVIKTKKELQGTTGKACHSSSSLRGNG